MSSIYASVISVFSFLTLISLVAYLTWKNEWLFSRLTNAEVRAARKESELEMVQQVRKIEMAVYEEKNKQLAAEAARAQADAAKALLLSGSKDSSSSQNILGAAGNFIGNLLGF
jgi:hypothetical protein